MRITSAQPRARLGPPPRTSPGRPSSASLAQSAPAGARPELLATGALLLVLAGVGYNALLAFMMARGLPISRTLVGLTEFLVLVAAALTLLRSGFRQSDTPAVLLIAFFVLNAVAVSLVNGAPFLDMGRNAAVVGIFLMLGLRVGERTVKRTFVLAASAVAVILLLESLTVTSYAALFEPGRYFEETRGISRFELDEIGLFANALGFDDRFSILNIVGHRTSSLFLEQVSLANFATVLTIYLVAMWKRLPMAVRILFPLLIAAILVTNNSRTALAIALIAPLVYLAAPKLPRLVTLGLVPLILTTAFIVTLIAPPTTEDNLVGRLSLTIRTLQGLDIHALVGAQAAQAVEFLDSGYTFVIHASSILGMIVLWLFFSLVPTGHSAALKRAGLMSGLYLFLNLTVSGTSIFSIKTAAVLWFLIGFLRREEEDEDRAMEPGPRRGLERAA